MEIYGYLSTIPVDRYPYYQLSIQTAYDIGIESVIYYINTRYYRAIKNILYEDSLGIGDLI